MEAFIDRFVEGRITRRQLMTGLVGLAAAAAGSKAALAKSGPTNGFEATALDHIALRVTDVERARDFYRDLLGMTVTRESDSNCFLSFEKGFLALFRGGEPAMDHYCYSVKNFDVRRTEEKLASAGIRSRVRGNRIYFDDPDGHVVQLAAERD